MIQNVNSQQFWAKPPLQLLLMVAILIMMIILAARDYRQRRAYLRRTFPP